MKPSPLTWLRLALVSLLAGGPALVCLLAVRGHQVAPARPEEAVATHPLDPLTAAEIDRATSLLTREHKLPADVLFPTLTLREPPKDEVLAYRDGQALRREAVAVVYDHTANRTSKALVDLTAGRVKSFEDVPDVQPRILFAEFDVVTDLVRADRQVQEALRKRGINDPSKVYVELWAGGPAGVAGKVDNPRLGRVLCYYDRDGSPYVRPIAGLTVFVDLGARRVLRVVDTGAVPVSDNPDNFFDLREVGPLRAGPQPLRTVQPRGPSFVVRGHEVRWQNWSFRFANEQREGLVIYQASYEDHGRRRPVLYRGSLAELVVPYGDADGAWSWRVPFDEGEYGLGILAAPLQRGKQVPENAVLFDSVLADDHGKSHVAEASVALYERDGGVLWSHLEGEHADRLACRRARELVVATVLVAGNYDYGINWVFTQDGVIKVEVDLGGIPLAKGVEAKVCERCAGAAPEDGAAKPGGADRYGTVVAPHIVAPNHQHWFCFRLDLDVDGPANTVSELNARHAGGDEGEAFVQEETVLATEQQARRDLDPAGGRHWKVFNPSRRTELGHFPGYVLEPGPNAGPQAGPDSALRRRAAFVDHPLWVTRYKPDERYPAGDYPNQSRGGDGLPRFAADDEKLAGEDVVLWYSCGVTHVPRPEDWPVMPNARTGFRLVPHAFFTRNPALDVPPEDAR